MDTEKRFFLFGAILVAMGSYQLYTGDVSESLLYFFAAGAFSTTGMSTRKDLNPPLKKILSILSWTFIIITGLIFFFMVRSEAYNF